MAGRRGSTFIRVVVDNAGANRRLDQTTGKVRGIGPAARLAAGAAVAAFGAIAVAIGGSIGPAAEFQTGLAEIATLSEEAKAGINGIGDSVKQTAVAFGQDLKDTTKAAYDAISAGIPTKEVGNFLKTAARAATGGLVDIATSVDVLTTSVNAWAKENLTAERASDILFSVVQRGKTTYDQLAGSLSNVANIAAAADISLEEVGAAVASLTSQGVPTSEAMTQIRGAVQGLIRDTPELISAFNAAGFASGEAAIRALGFGGAAKIVARSANGSLGAIQKMVGSVEGMNAILGVTGSNLELFNMNLEATRRSAGVSERAFNQLANTFEFQRRRVMQGFQLLRVELGSLFLPVLTEVARVIADFFGIAADSSDEEGEQTKSQFERIKEAVIAVKDSFAELLMEIGKFTNITGVFDPLVSAWEAAKGALGISGPLFSAEDLLPADTSLAGWVEALGFEIRQALDGLTDILKNQTLRDFAAGVSNILVALFSGGVTFEQAGNAFGRLLLGVFKDAIPSLKMSFKDAVVVDLLTDLENILAAYLANQVEWKTARAAFQTVVTGVFKVAASEIKTALDPATSAIGDFLTTIEEKFPNATTLIKNIAGAVSTLASNVKENSPTWTDFRDGFTQTLVDKVGQIAANLTTLATEADKLGGKLAEKLQPAFQWIKDNLPTIDARFAGVAIALGAFATFVRFFNPVGAALGLVVAGLATDWEKLNEQVLKFAEEQGLTEIWENIESAIVGAADQIRSFLQPVADTGDYAANTATDMGALLLAIQNFNAQQAPFDALIGAFNRLGASISTNQEVMEIINSQVLPPFREAWKELQQAWEENKEEILLLVTALTALAVGAIAAVIRGIGGLIRIIGGLVNIAEGVIGIFHAIAAALFGFGDAGKIFQGALDSIVEGLEEILRGLGPAILAVLAFTPIGRGLQLLGANVARYLQAFLVARWVRIFEQGGSRLVALFLEGLERLVVGIAALGGRLLAAMTGLFRSIFRGASKEASKFHLLGAVLRAVLFTSFAQIPIVVLDFVTSLFGTSLSEINDMIKDFVRQFTDAWNESEFVRAVSAVGEAFSALGTVITGLGEDFERVGRNWQEGWAVVFERLGEHFSNLGTLINGFVTQTTSAILNWVNNLAGSLYHFFTVTVPETFREGGVLGLVALAAALAALLAGVISWRIRMLRVFVVLISGIISRFTGLQMGLTRIWNTIVSAIGAGARRIGSYVDGALAGIRRIIRAARDAARAVKDVPVVGGVASAISNILPSFQGGGIIPGRLGQPVPILAHGGEEVLTPEQRRRGGDTYYVTHYHAQGSIIAERNVDDRVNQAGRRQNPNRASFGYV